jgi:acyl-CoA synthetase (AMP-forming)/AMP-acid ligase II
VCGARRRTYGELRDASRRVAAGLTGLGIESMDRVAVLSGNRLELPEIEIGIAGIGAIILALDDRLRPVELAEQLRLTGASAILVEERFLGPLLELRNGGALPALRTVVTLDAGPADLSYEEMVASSRAEVPLTVREPGRPHKICFRPRAGESCRAVVWTEGALVRNARQQVVEHRLGRDAATYAVIDICDVGGRHDLTWAALQQGATVHIARSGRVPSAEVFDYVATHGITHLAWAPDLPRNGAAVPRGGGQDAGRLAAVLCEWQSLDSDAIARARGAIPQVEVFQVFGLEDGGAAIAVLRAEDTGRGPQCAGRLVAGVEIKLAGPDGRPALGGACGDLQVRGPALCALAWEHGGLVSYDGDEGWIATGRRAYADDDGLLFIVGQDG